MPIAIKSKQGKLELQRRLAVNAKDGSILLRIPAGEFEMGDRKETNCPKHKVYVSEYWVGVYCVTNGQYGRFVAETKHREPDNKMWKDAGKRDHPVINISWDDCVAYGKWAGLSLPTEAQWEKAARGPLGLVYPWGDEWEEGEKCRNEKNRGIERTAVVSGYPQGVSGYGTYQQSGNVYEWCADWYGGDYYNKSSARRDPMGPETGSLRVIRGGGWRYGDASYFRGAFRDRSDPGYPDGDLLGFRLVRFP